MSNNPEDTEIDIDEDRIKAYQVTPRDAADYMNIPESRFADILKNHQGSICKTRVCREAHKRAKYYIDLIEKDRETFIIYELKKIDPFNGKNNIRTIVFGALGQILFYQTLCTVPAKKRILIVCPSDPTPEFMRESTIQFIEYIKINFNVTIKLVYFRDILNMENEEGYKEVQNDLELQKTYLKRMTMRQPR
jgi:hypothetical protein